MLKHKKQIIKY